jgi:methionyl aminopeptidase
VGCLVGCNLIAAGEFELSSVVVRILQKGQVITIEPFLSTECNCVEQQADGWMLSRTRGNHSAPYEHGMVITHKKPILLTFT